MDMTQQPAVLASCRGGFTWAMSFLPAGLGLAVSSLQRWLILTAQGPWHLGRNMYLNQLLMADDSQGLRGHDMTGKPKGAMGSLQQEDLLRKPGR